MNLWNEASEPLEWRSVLNALQHITVDAVRATLGQHGSVAYTDGACIRNPGGPAGWSVILVSSDHVEGEHIHKDAPRIECYGHIPRSENTTNNRAEIAAVLAALSLAPRDQPLVIHSDSDYTIKVAQGTYKMKANTDLWDYYRLLLKKRVLAPTFVWVRGHAGQEHNERADELAGLGAWNGDAQAYRRWQASNAPEAHNRPAAATAGGAGATSGAVGSSSSSSSAPLSPELAALRQQVQQLQNYFDSAGVNNPRIGANEREFIRDMAKRLQKNTFSPSEKQANWVNGLAKKYKEV